MPDDETDLEPEPVAEPEAPGPEVVREFRGTGIVPAVIVALIFGIAIVTFVAQNSESVGLEWFWLDFDASPAVLVLASLLIGIAADEVLGLLWRRSRRRRLVDRERLARLDSE